MFGVCKSDVSGERRGSRPASTRPCRQPSPYQADGKGGKWAVCVHIQYNIWVMTGPLVFLLSVAAVHEHYILRSMDPRDGQGFSTVAGPAGCLHVLHHRVSRRWGLSRRTE